LLEKLQNTLTPLVILASGESKIEKLFRPAAICPQPKALAGLARHSTKYLRSSIWAAI
jgi:hypothetical protein